MVGEGGKLITNFMQADKAIVDYFSNMYVTRGGAPVKVRALLASPDPNFVIEAYPSIVIMQMGDYVDNTRRIQEPSTIITSVDSEGRPVTALLKEPPEPIIIQYGIRIYTNSQRDSAELKTQMRVLLKRYAYTRINGRITNIDQISYRNPNAYSANFGETTRKENRAFIDQYLIKIATYIELLDTEPTGIATDINIGIEFNK
jgi:hypothetical protein